MFDPFEAIVLFLAVLVVNYSIQDGRANYMEGFILMMVRRACPFPYLAVMSCPFTSILDAHR